MEEDNQYITDLISEAAKSERWQQWTTFFAENAESNETNEDPEINLSNSTRSSILLTSASRPAQNQTAFPINLTPSKLYMQYEHAIDTAMREIRNLKHSVRDENWEENNSDQLVSSLFALSRSCLECVEILVTRQEFDRHKVSAAQISKPFAESDLMSLENNSEKLNNDLLQPLEYLEEAIKNFQNVKTLHSEIETTTKKKQIKMKENQIYYTPVVHLHHQITDQKSLENIDPDYVDYNSIEEFLSSLWRTPTHPFCKALNKFVEYFNDIFLLHPDLEKFDSMILSFHKFVEKEALSNGITKSYEQLDLVRWKNELTKSLNDQLMASLYRSILPLYLLKHHERDQLVDRKIFALSKLIGKPKALGVRSCYCVVIDTQKDTSGTEDHENFHTAVQLFREIPTLTSISSKLFHLSEALNVVCHSIENFYFHHIKTSISISADDLLSLFVYVLIASQTSGLYSQCRMLDEFIGDESALGEEGYAVATFDTALGVIRSLDELKMISNKSE